MITMSGKVTFKLDGLSIETEKGTIILEAAELGL
jgi:hypothetical protein